MKYKNIDGSYKLYKLSIIWGTLASLFILFLIKLGVKTPMVFSIKDIIIYLYVFFYFKIWFKDKSLMLAIFILIFLIFLIFNYLILNPQYESPINNIRQIIAPLIVLMIYSGISLSCESQKKILNFLSKITIFIFVFGFFSQIFNIWEKLNLSDFFLLKNIPVNSNGLSYMFYEPMFNNRERMISVFLDPISLGHFFATLGAFLFFFKDKNKVQKMAFYSCLFGLFLCLSKGAILQFFICAFLLNNRIHIIIRFLFVILIFIVITSILQNLDITGILLHIGGFNEAIATLSFWGHGIGSSGNYASMFSSQMLSLGIGDTYVGALLGQIGIFGTLLWILLAFSIIVFSKADQKSIFLSLKLFFSIFIVSILSENTMNVTSFLFPAIIIGICINTKEIELK